MDQNFQTKMILMDNSGGILSDNYTGGGLSSGNFLSSGLSSEKFSNGGFSSSSKETNYELKVVKRTTQVSHQCEYF